RGTRAYQICTPDPIATIAPGVATVLRDVNRVVALDEDGRTADRDGGRRVGLPSCLSLSDRAPSACRPTTCSDRCRCLARALRGRRRAWSRDPRRERTTASAWPG